MVKLLSESELIREITFIVNKIIKNRIDIYWFGSRVEGNFKVTSDYDICLDAGRKISGGEMQEIRDNLERLPVMQKIDLSDFYTLNTEFKKKLKINGIKINKDE